MSSGCTGGGADWQRVEELYHEALAKSPAERSGFLDSACGGNAELRREVRSLLASIEQDGARLEVPAFELAARMFSESSPPAIQKQSPDAARVRAKARPDGSFRPGAAVLRALGIFRRAPWWLWILAAVFAGDCTLRSYCLFFGPNGFDFRQTQEQGRIRITIVAPDSAAEHAGLQPGDFIVAIDGQKILRPTDWRGIRVNLEVGHDYRVDIERDGQSRQVVYRMERVRFSIWRILIVWQVDAILLAATAFLIAFSKPTSFLPQLGALALATLSASLAFWSLLPPGYAPFWRALPWGVRELLWIPNLCSYLVGPIVLSFFLLFPRPLFRARWPWVLLWLPALAFVPIYSYTAFLIVYRPLQAYGHIISNDVSIAGVRLFGLYGLAALGALVVNYFRLTDRNDRRRLKVLLIGGTAAVLPGGFRLAIWRFGPLLSVFRWLGSGVPDLVLAVIFALLPISFAYSILRHRLLDIRLILRQGVQYAVTKGTFLSVVPLLGVILLSDLLAHGNQPLRDILEMRGWVYVTVGALAVGAHIQRRRWGEAIDRRFFREQYDAHGLLREVAEETGRVRNFEDAASTVTSRIEMALHPQFAAVMQRTSGDASFRTLVASPQDKAPSPLKAESRLVSILRILSEPLEISLGDTDWLVKELPESEVELLREERFDLLVPVSLAPDHDEAVLALGAKRSEEPYTRQDQDLLAAIAANLELLLLRPKMTSPVPQETFEECPRCGTCYDQGTGSCSLDGSSLLPVGLPRTLERRYRLEMRLGRGGMGAVYEAADEALGRRVAVKVIREDRLYSHGALQRFQREARAAAGFAHPNVVTVYDYGIAGGIRAFLVMELLKGLTLREELQSKKRLDGARTISLFSGLCKAVEAAHSRQLIHRDLKPANIFLVRTADESSETVKVLDFGIAKFLPGEEAKPEGQTLGETDAGTLIGTPGYMCPEQLLGETASVTWDLWALAVTAYETLTGSLPFPSSNMESWRKSVLEGDFVPIHEHLPYAPSSWQEFFTLCLSKDAARRPSSAGDFLSLMEKTLDLSPGLRSED